MMVLNSSVAVSPVCRCMCLHMYVNDCDKVVNELVILQVLSVLCACLR